MCIGGEKRGKGFFNIKCPSLSHQKEGKHIIGRSVGYVPPQRKWNVVRSKGSKPQMLWLGNAQNKL
jgi:hypothetical protein